MDGFEPYRSTLVEPSSAGQASAAPAASRCGGVVARPKGHAARAGVMQLLDTFDLALGEEDRVRSYKVGFNWIIDIHNHLHRPSGQKFHRKGGEAPLVDSHQLGIQVDLADVVDAVENDSGSDGVRAHLA